MSGITDKVLVAIVFLFSSSVFGGEECRFESDEVAIQEIRSGARLVSIGSTKIPVPQDQYGMELTVSEGRAQFAFRRPEKGIEGADAKKTSVMRAWSDIASIVFTRRGKFDPSSEVFSILRTCDVGAIRALFLGFKGVDGDFNGKEILLVQVPGYASVLVLGEELDVYLNLVRAVN